MPGPEDGMLLVTVLIGKWSRRRSGHFLVGAAGCDFLVEPTLGVTVVVGASRAPSWCSVHCSRQEQQAGPLPAAVLPKMCFPTGEFCLFCPALVLSLPWAKWNCKGAGVWQLLKNLNLVLLSEKGLVADFCFLTFKKGSILYYILCA